MKGCQDGQPLFLSPQGGLKFHLAFFFFSKTLNLIFFSPNTERLNKSAGLSRLKAVPVNIILSSLMEESKSNLADFKHNPNKNKSNAVQTALIPLTACQPVPLKVIMGYKYTGY